MQSWPSFQEFRKLLDDWQAVTIEMCPDRPDLYAQIPPSENMSPSKLLGSTMTTDTCATAVSLRSKFLESVYEYCRTVMLMEEDSIERIREGDCWQHLRNIICNGIKLEMRSYLNKILEKDLAIIPPNFRMQCGLDNICRMCDKEFNPTRNYSKGHGTEFLHWMHTNRSGVLLMPIVRALGGKRQDGSFEGALPIYMGWQ